MLRVWGGGFYEEDRFYDFCDRYGILVWQDFVFACSIYPLDREDFVANLRQEMIENVRRLRHRASLALWCGNNEMEWGWESWGWAAPDIDNQQMASLHRLAETFPPVRNLLEMAEQVKPLDDWQVLRDAYVTFFHTTLPAWVKEWDPDGIYWPSSPSSDTPFRNVNGQDRGRCPLLGRVAWAQAFYRLPQPVSALHERVRLPGLAAACHRKHLCRLSLTGT